MRILAWAAAVLHNRWGAVPRPAWCTYLTTYRCNARCRMCDSWRVTPGNELTPTEVSAVFGQLGRLDVVRLTGGEPFLRCDLPAVAEAILAASRPTVLHISTNGSHPDRVLDLADRFSRPGRLHFMVSLDGLEAEHDRNRGAAAPFGRALATIRGLAERRAALGIGVSVNHTIISPQSLNDAPGVRAVVAACGVEVHTVVAYAESAMYGAANRGLAAEHMIVPVGYPLHAGLDRADVVGFVEGELRRTATYRSRLLRWGKHYYLRGLLARLRREAAPRPRPRCVALRSHIRLLPDGRVPVCQFNTQVVGDLRHESLANVWREQAAAARRWVDACPGCWAECEVLPSAVYTGDILTAACGNRRRAR